MVGDILLTAFCVNYSELIPVSSVVDIMDWWLVLLYFSDIGFVNAVKEKATCRGFVKAKHENHVPLKIKNKIKDFKYWKLERSPT